MEEEDAVEEGEGGEEERVCGWAGWVAEEAFEGGDEPRAEVVGECVLQAEEGKKCRVRGEVCQRFGVAW